MHAFLGCWAGAFGALVLALLITMIIYRSMGDGLDLNGWLQEGLTALFVSAGQAGGYLLEQHFPNPRPFQIGTQGGGSVAAIIFVLSLWLGYKITHLVSWDPLEYVILGLVDGCLSFIALLALG
jgi:hypothetical protein